MKIDNNNYKEFTWLVLFLVAISATLAYYINFLLKANNLEVPYYLDIPISTPAIYALLFVFFNRVLWKLKMFRILGIVKADNLEGKWVGFLKSSYDEFAADIPAELEITQTATSVKIKGKFNESRSCSVHESFGESEIHGSSALFYFYRNEPNYDAMETMSIHEGSVKLNYDKATDSLSGYYYSGRDRNNHGTISVKRINK